MGLRLMYSRYVQNPNSYFALTFSEDEDVNHVAADEKGNGMGVWKCSQPEQKQISGLLPALEAEERANPDARAPEELARCL